MAKAPRILVVDDAPEIVSLLKLTLSRQGYEVSTAYSGEQGLCLAAKEEPDLVLLDICLPDISGLEVCRRLKAEARFERVFVIVLTALDRKDEIVEGLDAGADGYITKPFAQQVLAAHIRSALRKKAVHDKLSRAYHALEETMAHQRCTEEQLRQKDEQLRQVQKIEALGQLAGGIAHEFNNLLQAISGYTRYAMEGLSPEERRYEDLQQVVKASDRATTLTRQLLGFSRRHPIEPRNLDPNQVVADVADMLRPTIGEHVSLEVIPGNNVGTVYADAAELQQSLLNLCINARDAMPSGGRLLLKTDTVVLTKAFRDPRFHITPGRHVVFSISDTGCGMSAEVQRHLFEPFFTTKGVGKGTGLGLPMVYGTVQQHNGAIDVSSEPGKGTTFNVYLPTADKYAEDDTIEEPAHLPGGTETILVAEDEPMVRSLAVRILESAGYTVLAACDGDEALQVFEENRSAISLVLLDAIMPKTTGYEVCRRITTARPQVRVVFISGYDPDATQCDFIVEENLRLIEKPFDAAMLLNTVREVLDGSHVSDEREAPVEREAWDERDVPDERDGLDEEELFQQVGRS